MSATVIPTIDLDFEMKWWLLLPREFPTERDANVAEWAVRVAAESNVQSQWLPAEYRTLLPQLLLEQYEGFDRGHTAILWWAPTGLPASGYVTIDIERRPEGMETSVAGVTEGLTSLIVAPPQAVSTEALGEGVGFTRLRPASAATADSESDDTGYAETSYIFWPGDYLVLVTAKSPDPGMIGLMGPELWSIVESLKLND